MLVHTPPGAKARVVVLLYLSLMAAWALPAAAAVSKVEQQRSDFQEAYQAGLDGDSAKFNALSRKLTDYVLHPYLAYAGLKVRLDQADASEVSAFMKRYADTPLDWRMRDAWLRELARRGDWKTFLAFYRPTSDTSLRCDHLLARLETGDTDGLGQAALDLWLVGHSQPDACDPLFEWLYHSGKVTEQVRFERTARALEAGNGGLAGWLARKLSDEHRRWYQRWRAMIASPETTLEKALDWDDGPVARRIVLDGLRRVAHADDGGAAWRHWQSLDDKFGFSSEERNRIIRELALDAATDYHDDALQRLSAIPPEAVDGSVRAWGVRVSLQRRDWPRVLAAIEALPGAQQAEDRWRYWKGRALEAAGEIERARLIYDELSAESDYYGFLAADRVGRPYALSDATPPPDAGAIAELARRPAMARAVELYHVGFLLSARREWNLALTGADRETLRQAAWLAAQQGWYDRAVAATADGGDEASYRLRFPLAHEQLIRRQARGGNLQPAWLFGLVRAESGFVSDAVSPAGARGLMQLMPGTARRLSGDLGLVWRGSAGLSAPEVNMVLGTAYLEQMMARYGDNMVLATAAYNAGPRVVDRWIQENSARFPAIWAETIPFFETRDYIQRVLAYTVVYEWRMGGKLTRLSALMPEKAPALAASGGGCPLSASACMR